MVGEVMTGKADLALADLTITSKREKVVDFTVPYMQTGITILFSQPSWGLRTFKSIEDLIKQDISFSCVEGGATERFFKNSKIPEYNQAWNMMNDFDLMTKNNNEVYMITFSFFKTKKTFVVIRVLSGSWRTPGSLPSSWSPRAQITPWPSTAAYPPSAETST